MSDSIFDEEFVDCNTCQCYWTDQCNGKKLNEYGKCNSYIAYRKIDVLNRLEVIENNLNKLAVSVLGLAIVLLICLVIKVVILI